MHVIFIPYGKVESVETTLNDMKAQKFQVPIHSPNGKQTEYIWFPSQLRVLPFGFYELIIPREQLDVVLNTLGDKSERYDLSKTKLAMIRKALHAKPVPKYKTDKKCLWTMNDVHMILIGIREDTDITDDKMAGKYKGWTHEAI